ncbi:hypothetical protein A4A49_32146 [Nicotiana attenuata]|uniref:Uncharacterized protein n=1 Tax=Nicotiana attenuata TaxID=49451 RepID=A0A1J6KDU0_NICAT|nr:hypothetical protein A4A49_32146 [Nicotiana attenuata]
MARGRGRARERPRLQPLAGISKPVEAPMQPEKTPVAEIIKTLVPLDNAKMKQQEIEVIIQEPAKRLDLSISPSLRSHTDKSTGKFEDLASTSKSTPDLAPVIEKKGATDTWTSLFAGSCSSENGLKLSYIPPKIIDGKTDVQLEKEDVDKEILKWRCAIIVYVIGETSGYNYKHRFVKQSWNQVVELEIEAEQHKVEQPRRRRRPNGNAQPAPQPVVT